MRFQTYFGVPIPPWKEPCLGAGATTIRFVITGPVPSKKNHQQALAVRSPAKQFLRDLYNQKQTLTLEEALQAIDMVKGKMRGNAAYQEWLQKTLPVLLDQKHHWTHRLAAKGLLFPLRHATMTLRLYFKDRYISDTVNKQQTIQDALIAAGILANDDYNTLNPITSASACYADELLYSITFISLSFKLKP